MTSDERKGRQTVDGRQQTAQQGSAEFRFAETLRFVLRESRRLRRTRSLRYLAVAADLGGALHHLLRTLPVDRPQANSA